MRSRRSNCSVAVVGGGLAGTCAALALAKRGIDVILLEQDPLLMNRASLRNEGKIHLGFVYANDASMATATLMLRGALSFGRIMRDLVGKEFSTVGISTPFQYLVARDSILDSDSVQSYFENLDAIYLEMMKDGLEYLDSRPEVLFRVMADNEWTGVFSPDRVETVFHTEELAVDSDDLARVVREAVDRSPRIDVRTLHTVESVSEGANGYRLAGRTPEGEFQVDAEQVINASWERRAVIDRQFEIEPEATLLHRLKYRVIAELPQELRSGPSATMVVGRYGDVVVRPNGSAYLSWYPTGLRGWTHDLEPPRSWDRPCQGRVDAAVRDDVIKDTVANVDAWYPGIRFSRPTIVDAGVVVALGLTDVDDPQSGLHERIQVGVKSTGGYHSVDSGKLTTAPMFALQASESVLAAAGVVID